MLSDIRISHRLTRGGWMTRADLGGSFADFPGFLFARSARRQAADLMLHAPH
jgi:hypothetical protein